MRGIATTIFVLIFVASAIGQTDFPKSHRLDLTAPLGSIKNPVRAFRPAGQREYLRRLRCPDGKPPKFERQGSIGRGPYGNILDMYDVKCESIPPISIAMDMYHPGYRETSAVQGLSVLPVMSDRSSKEARSAQAGPKTKKGSIQEAKELNARIRQLYGKGRYSEAIPFARRVLSIHESVLGPVHLDTASSLSNLGTLYRGVGNYNKAKPLLERALAIREKALGPSHPDTAASLNNLAYLYQAAGAYAKAEPLYHRALSIRKQALGSEHPDTAISLNNLAELYYDNGAYVKAERLFQRSLAIRLKVLGQNHQDTATSLTGLALIYRSRGDYARAEPLFQQALAIYEKTSGPGHPYTAAALHNLSYIYQATGAHAKAEPLLQRALAIREKMLGPEHPDTATTINDLAYLYNSRDFTQQSRLAVLQHGRLRQGRTVVATRARDQKENTGEPAPGDGRNTQQFSHAISSRRRLCQGRADV
jgi:tetratricopeptide (TPR) repeat protein